MLRKSLSRKRREQPEWKPPRFWSLRAGRDSGRKRLGLGLESSAVGRQRAGPLLRVSAPARKQGSAGTPTASAAALLASPQTPRVSSAHPLSSVALIRAMRTTTPLVVAATQEARPARSTVHFVVLDTFAPMCVPMAASLAPHERAARATMVRRKIRMNRGAVVLSYCWAEEGRERHCERAPAPSPLCLAHPLQS